MPVVAARLRFATSILQRLGEELSSSPDQGIIELVRNSYDADALNCTVQIVNNQKPSRLIRVTDDGLGMNVDELRDGFLVIGRSKKNQLSRTPRYNRLPVGSKGLGRLAALRLGRIAKVTSRPIGEHDFQYEMTLNWDEIDASRIVDEIDIPISRIQYPKALSPVRL